MTYSMKFIFNCELDTKLNYLGEKVLRRESLCIWPMGMSAGISLIAFIVGRFAMNVLVTFWQQPRWKDVDTADSSADNRVSFIQLPTWNEE